MSGDESFEGLKNELCPQVGHVKLAIDPPYLVWMYQGKHQAEIFFRPQMVERGSYFKI